MVCSERAVDRRMVLRRGAAALVAAGGLAGCTRLSGMQTQTTTETKTPRSLSATPERMTPFDASEHSEISDVEPIEWEIHRLTNVARKEHGVTPVEWHDGLAYVARDHSRDMDERDFMDHENPDGEMPWDRTARYGIDLYSPRENIFTGGTRNVEHTPEALAEYAFDNWRTSEKGHWENILDGEHTHHGAGVYLRDYAITATQLFAREGE